MIPSLPPLVGEVSRKCYLQACSSLAKANLMRTRCTCGVRKVVTGLFESFTERVRYRIDQRIRNSDEAVRPSSLPCSAPPTNSPISCRCPEPVSANYLSFMWLRDDAARGTSGKARALQCEGW